jgi:AraC family transcriptional regulator
VVPGDLHLIPGGTSRWTRWDQATEVLMVVLEPTFVAAIADAGRPSGRWALTPRAAFRDPVIAHLLLALRADLQSGCPAGRLYGESLATALAVHLLRRYGVRPAKPIEARGGLSPGQLRRVVDYVQAHVGDDINLPRLAAVVQLSPHHFAALFKQSTGVTPYQYVLQQRLAKAQALLEGTRLSLAEISYRVGFSSQAHFTTMFRKRLGTTPGCYRKRL